MTGPAGDPNVMPLKELAELVRLFPHSIYRMLKHNQLPGAFKLGSRYYFNREQIEAWMNSTPAATDTTVEAPRPRGPKPRVKPATETPTAEPHTQRALSAQPHKSSVPD
jgi:excisionase family DNA binding protein